MIQETLDFGDNSIESTYVGEKVWFFYFMRDTDYEKEKHNTQELNTQSYNARHMDLP